MSDSPDTVDGRNPAPPGMYNPVMGYLPFQPVSRISSINRRWWKMMEANCSQKAMSHSKPKVHHHSLDDIPANHSHQVSYTNAHPPATAMAILGGIHTPDKKRHSTLWFRTKFWKKLIRFSSGRVSILRINHSDLWFVVHLPVSHVTCRWQCDFQSRLDAEGKRCDKMNRMFSYKKHATGCRCGLIQMHIWSYMYNRRKFK